MIQANEFVERARGADFGWWAGVPCSFLKPFINYVIDDDELTYVSSANEGDAVATAAGAVLAGRGGIAMMQNSGLGNAVSPLSSLTWVFRLPVLVIVTWRGEPGLRDEPQHELMGTITAPVLETLQLPWEFFPDSADEVGPALERALGHMRSELRPYAFVMRKGTVAPHALSEAGFRARPPREDAFRTRLHDRPSGDRPSRREALTAILGRTPTDRTVVIASTGYTGRELFALDDRPNQLYMVGSMGCASSLGLGLSLARPDLRVVVLEGDGAALMRMGNIATIGAYAGDNFVHVLLDNEVHDSTGGQATVSGGVSFARIAGGCGYAMALEGDSVETLEECFEAAAPGGPRLAHLKIRPGTLPDLPRPSLSPVEVKERLMDHIGAGAAPGRGAR